MPNPQDVHERSFTGTDPSGNPCTYWQWYEVDRSGRVIVEHGAFRDRKVALDHAELAIRPRGLLAPQEHLESV
jgi:hypothetical protein